MLNITIVHGRRINKILFIIFFSMFVALLFSAAVFDILGNLALSETFFILAAIFGAFALLYGILWAVFASREKKKNELLNLQMTDNIRQNGAEFPDVETFTLPKAELVQLAKNRLWNIIKWLWISAGIIFLLCYVPGSVLKGFGSLSRLIITAAICAFIAVLGMVIQGAVYISYTSRIPEKIGLYYGRLSVDDMVYPAYEILEVSISAPTVLNTSSSKAFRTFTVVTAHSKKVYDIDFRSPSVGKYIQPRWDEYGEFCRALTAWCSRNNVAVKMDFMD